MTRFVYLCDTHLGADPVGYHQQPAYPDKLPELLRRLDAWIAADGDIDFVLHGGDMVDRATEANIRAASDAFALCRPVRLCLGNHDLTRPDALDLWLALAPQFFDGGPQFSMLRDDCAVHVAASHWEARPYFWDAVQVAQFRPGTAGSAGSHHGRPRWLAGVLHALPGVGRSTRADRAGRAVASAASQLCRRDGRTCGATRQSAPCAGRTQPRQHPCRAHGVHYVTGSAFWETPFEFKLIELDAERLRVQTVALARPRGQAAYDWRKTWVQGCGATRAFSARW